MNRDDFKVCREYAALDLIFNLYDIGDGIDGRVEQELYREFRSLLSKPVGDIEDELRRLRIENKNRMEFLTAITDRLVAYEYVLNRIELRFTPEEKLDDFLKSNPEDAFLNRMIIFLTRGGDKRVFGTRLQSVVGEIPIQITRNKLFEHIDHTLTLYLDSDETAIDELIYMLRMVGLVASSGEQVEKYLEEYTELAKPLKDFEDRELASITEEEYNRLRDEIFSLSGTLQNIMDFYNEFQRCVNDLLAIAVVSRWLPGDESIFEEREREALQCFAVECDGESGAEIQALSEEKLIPLEGRIEGLTVRLERIMSQVEAPDMNLWEEEQYQDVALLARLLSNSVFADIDPLFVETKTVTKEMIREKEDILFAELTESMKASPRPVRRAITAKVLEKLPPFLHSQKEIEEYFRVNLFGCRDKAERCAAMAFLIEMEEQEQQEV